MDNFGDVYNWTNAGYTGKVKAEHILWIDFTGIPAKGLNTNGELPSVPKDSFKKGVYY